MRYGWKMGGICICVYIYMCICIYMYVYVYMCICVWYMYVCVHVCEALRGATGSALIESMTRYYRRARHYIYIYIYIYTDARLYIFGRARQYMGASRDKRVLI